MELIDILDFEDEKIQRELEAIYGSTIKSREDVDNLDDITTKEEKKIVGELESQKIPEEKCPFLNKRYNYFYYCSKRAEVLEKMKQYKRTDKPSIWSSQYNAKANPFSLQLWCMQPEEKYSKCIIFKGEDF